MTIPTIHLNGTSKRELLDQLSDVSDALNTAYGALKRAAPNGRDYYPQGAAAMEAALAEHLSRLRRVDDVKGEIDKLAEAISFA